jgi:hypothetical protein
MRSLFIINRAKLIEISISSFFFFVYFLFRFCLALLNNRKFRDDNIYKTLLLLDNTSFAIVMWVYLFSFFFLMQCRRGLFFCCVRTKQMICNPYTLFNGFDLSLDFILFFSTHRNCHLFSFFFCFLLSGMDLSLRKDQVTTNKAEGK